MQLRHYILGGIIVATSLTIGVLYFLLRQQLTKEANSFSTTVYSSISSLDKEHISSPLPPSISPYKGSFISSDSSSYNIEILNASFLHNPSRNYYGNEAPSNLDILWKHDLGFGITKVGQEEKTWKGAGWTGQPLMVIENEKKYLIQGAFDHNLKKIDAETGKLVWQYTFDDVIKGTGSLWINHNADSLKNFCIILQGSRAGKSTYASYVPSFRAISYFTGEELWRLNSVKTHSYSRDVDASALLWQDTAYIGLENSIFTVFNPNPNAASIRDKMLQPQIYRAIDTLYTKKDRRTHGGNLVTEASPTLLGNRVYIASGAGHVWGYNLMTKQMDWDYFIGSDIDGTAVVTEDSCLLVAVEKQYIDGYGGLLKLDPKQTPAKAAKWFFPTDNIPFTLWEGGIIGSAAVNSSYKKDSQVELAAFTAIDGYFYVVNTKEVEPNISVCAYDSSLFLPQPKLLFKYKTGPSISTPLIIGNKVVVTTYKGIYLFEFDQALNFSLLARNKIRCESTPFVDDKKIYVASRNGYLYCLGKQDSLVIQ